MRGCLLRLVLEAVARQFRVLARDGFQFRNLFVHRYDPGRRALRAHRSSVTWRPMVRASDVGSGAGDWSDGGGAAICFW